jgi:pseudoazurin
MAGMGQSKAECTQTLEGQLQKATLSQCRGLADTYLPGHQRVPRSHDGAPRKHIEGVVLMKKLILSAALGAMALAPAAFAQETHTVEMRNAGSDGQPMVFEPAYLEVAPGDTVTFVNAQGAHNAQQIDGMWPEGAEGFMGRMNQDASYTFTEEGVYGLKCMPHYGAGMVALIKVGEGEPANLEEASGVRHPGRARGRMEGLLEQVAG